MFFILSKTIGLLSSPSTIIILFIFLAFAFKSDVLRRISAFLALIITFLFTNQALYTYVIQRWAVPIVPISTVSDYDVAIVLGGASRIDMSDTDRVFLNENAGDRIVHAVQLYKTGKVKKILFTSGSAALTGMKISEASQAKKLFYMLGVPKEDLLLEDRSRNTYENALYSKQILDTLNLGKKYMLVSNGLHLKRGLACFEKLGVKCTPFSIDNDGDYDRKEWHMYIMPKIYVMSGWERFFHEYFGYWAYKFQGYI